MTAVELGRLALFLLTWGVGCFAGFTIGALYGMRRP